MKKGDRIEALARELATGDEDDIYFRGYFLLFNRQEYYEAHDLLEHIWLQTTGPEAAFYKGLIQLAGAFVHLQKQYRRPDHPTDGRRLRPAWRLFQLAQTNLEPYLPTFLDLDLRSVLELCSTNMRAIEGADFKSNPWNPTVAPLLSL